jgi:hypothetical protein
VVDGLRLRIEKELAADFKQTFTTTELQAGGYQVVTSAGSATLYLEFWDSMTNTLLARASTSS